MRPSTFASTISLTIWMRPIACSVPEKAVTITEAGSVALVRIARAVPAVVKAVAVMLPAVVTKRTGVPSGTSRPCRSRTSTVTVAELRPSATSTCGWSVRRMLACAVPAAPAKSEKIPRKNSSREQKRLEYIEIRLVLQW
jgi:hypothetical protein